MRSRADSLEFALLGLLSESPLHGYELRKRLMAIFGPFRALSFSVLYPQLKRMVIAEVIEAKEIGVTSKRTRIVYTITKKGLKRFAELNGSVTADAWEDEGFGVRFAFFSPTTTMNRVRILEDVYRVCKIKRNRCEMNLIRIQLGLISTSRSGAASHSSLLSVKSHGLRE